MTPPATPIQPSPSRVVLGRVLGAFGIKGWLRIKPLGHDAESLLQQPVWGLDLHGTVREVRVDEAKGHGGTVVARFAGIDDRGQAEALRGADVTVARAALPAAAPGEYYWNDLIGLMVRNEQGVELGKVSGLIEAPAHDVLRVVSGAGGEDGDEASPREQLIPFVEPIVRSVDIGRGSITVDWQKDY